MKNRFSLWLWLTSSVLLIGSCSKEDNKGQLRLSFDPVYGNQALEIQKTYQLPSGLPIRFSKSDFFLSDLYLIKEDNSKLVIQEIAFVDLTAKALPGAQPKDDLVIKDIPGGKYKRLGFGIGVKPELNKKVPADFRSDHPLSMSSHYWTPWKSYIFSKLEGFVDTLGKGNFDLSFLYHTGMDGLYAELYVDVPLQINADGNNKLVFTLDHQALLAPSGGPELDIKKTPVNHDPNNLAPIQAIMNNFVRAIKVQIL